MRSLPVAQKNGFTLPVSCIYAAFRRQSSIGVVGHQGRCCRLKHFESQGMNELQAAFIANESVFTVHRLCKAGVFVVALLSRPRLHNLFLPHNGTSAE